MIPNIIHFIWLTGPKSRPFSYINAVAVKAAAKIQKPSKILMHCNAAPVGNANWDSVSHLFELRHVEPPTEIKGVPLDYVQYQADVLRLRILFNLGGIYLDTDSLLLRPLTPLMERDFTLARESDTSIAMAPIFAMPGEEFIHLWLERMPQAIQKHIWSSHAVQLPHEIYREYPHLCDVRPQQEFFPLDLKHNYLFEEEPRAIMDALARVDGAYAIHVYETYWRDYIKHVTPEYMQTHQSLFTRLFKPLA
jgi:hypothetical protein